MPKDDRGGTQTFWRSWGEAAPELLLIHCSMAHSKAWAAVAEGLARPAVAFDLPGHGRSDPADPARDLHDQSAAMAEAFLGPDPIDVIGHSYGGTIALRLAVEAPQRLRRLVLIEPVYFAALRDGPKADQPRAIFTEFDAAIERGDMAEAARIFTARWGTGADWDSLSETRRTALAEQVALIPRQGPGIHEDRAGVLAAGRLEACDLPVLLIQGAECEPAVDSICARLAERLPMSSRATIPGAGHMAPISHPEAVAAVIAEFFQRP